MGCHQDPVVIVLLDPRLGSEQDAADLADTIRDVRRERAEAAP